MRATHYVLYLPHPATLQVRAELAARAPVLLEREREHEATRRALQQLTDDNAQLIAAERAARHEAHRARAAADFAAARATAQEKAAGADAPGRDADEAVRGRGISEKECNKTSRIVWKLM